MATAGADNREFRLRAADADDLAGVFELVIASDLREFGEPDYTFEEFKGDWDELDIANDSQVAVDRDGRIVGYATCSSSGDHVQVDAEGYVHPELEARGIGTSLILWMEGRAAGFVPLAPDGARVVLHNPTNAYNNEATALLTGLGYQLARNFWRMQIGLDAAPEAAPAPDGIILRQVATEEDEFRLYEAVQEAFEDHWGHAAKPFDRWSASNKRHGFDPGLWWMALDGDELAGGLVSFTLPDPKGWVRYVAVRRPWRRRGLAQALLARAFGAFQERGISTVELGVDAESLTGATRLYERVGMKVVRGFAIFEKELRAGEVPTEPEEG